MAAKKNQPHCVTVGAWLKSNLGKHCLGVLTSNDADALRASVEIVNAFCYSLDESKFAAWGACVRLMQPEARHLAFHAVAHVLDWRDRGIWWEGARLEGFVTGDAPRSVALYSPEGRDLLAAKIAAGEVTP